MAGLLVMPPCQAFENSAFAFISDRDHHHLIVEIAWSTRENSHGA